MYSWQNHAWWHDTQTGNNFHIFLAATAALEVQMLVCLSDTLATTVQKP